MQTNEEEESAGGRRGQERSARAGLVFVSLLVGLILAEVIVRALDVAPDVALIQAGRYRLSANPKIGYEPAPLVYQGDQLVYFDYRGASNRMGFRDTDHQIAKPEGVYRIILLGDSIGAGLEISRFEDMFAPIIESLLRAKGLTVELINLSVSGYNTQQEVETLKDRGLQFDPDLVLLQYCLNDRQLDNGQILAHLLREEMRESKISAVRLQPILLRSELFRFLRFRVIPYRRPTGGDQAALHQAISGDTVAASLAELKALSEQYGFEVLTVIFPTFVSFDPYADYALHQAVQSDLDRLRVPSLDLLEDMRRCAESLTDSEQRKNDDLEPIGHDFLHPNELGHRCAAHAIAREVAKQIPPWARRQG